MPRCYVTTGELVEITGISTEDIKEMIEKSQITAYPSDEYGHLFPITVVNQLKALNYKNIPDVVPYGRTGYNAIDYDPWWANDGEYEVYLEPNQKLPKGYQSGRLPKKEERISESLPVQEVSAT